MKLRNMFRLGTIFAVLMVSATIFISMPAKKAFADPPAVWNGTVDTDWYDESENEFNLLTGEQLAGLAFLVNDGNDFEGKTVKLGSDIVLNETADWLMWSETNAPANLWTPIGYNDKIFNGTFEGQEKTISGLYIYNEESTAAHGLFGNVGTSGLIRLTDVVDSYVNLPNGQNIAAIAGKNSGTIENCFNSGIVKGYSSVGGVVGRSEGTIKNSYNNGNIEGENTFVGGVVGRTVGNNTVLNCHNYGQVRGFQSVGGIIGKNERDSGQAGLVQYCTNSGIIIGNEEGWGVGGVVGYNEGTIQYCSNLSDVSSKELVGGIAGKHEYGVIEFSYNDGDITATNVLAGGIAGYSINSIFKSYNTGTITGYMEVGGIAGLLYGNFITDCYNTGSIYASFSGGGITGESYATLTNCYNTGYIHGNWMTGGITGTQSSNELVKNCYYIDTNPQNYNKIGTEKTEEDFRRGDVAYNLQIGQTELVFGHSTLDGTQNPQLVFFDMEAIAVLRVNFIDSFHETAIPRYAFPGGTLWSAPVIQERTGYSSIWVDFDIEQTFDVDNEEFYAAFTPNDYIVTFDYQGANAATMITDKVVTFDSEYGMLPEPAKTGYLFAGWFTLASEGTQITDSTMMTTTQNHTLYARWNIITYNIVYVLNDGINHVNNPTTYTVENALAMYDATKENYDFLRWSVTFDHTNHTITATASYSAKVFSITYVLDGGTISPVSPVKYTYGSPGAVRTPAKTGYTFAGWAEMSGTIIMPGTSGNLTLTAQWTVKVYNIIYVLNDGENSLNNPNTYTIEDEITFENPIKSGYTFDGWTEGIQIALGSTGNKTFTAEWSVADYAITYVLNGGTNSVLNPNTYTMFDTDITLINPTKTGYTFDGWTEGSQIEAGSTGNKIFTAEWTVINYDISYVLDGGTNNEINPSKYTVEDELAIYSPAKAGYTFDGWTEGSQIAQGSTGNKTFTAEWTVINYDITYALAGGTNSADNPSKYTVEDELKFENPTKAGYDFDGWNMEFDNAQSLLITAQWKIRTYKIIFDGADIDDILFTVESQTILLETPQKEGYIFKGWFTSRDYDSESITEINHGSTGNVRLFAKWEAEVIDEVITNNTNWLLIVSIIAILTALTSVGMMITIIIIKKRVSQK